MDPHLDQPLVTAGVPLNESRAVMIMVHGRNAGPKNILDLVPRLNREGFTYLAPAAADNTWYPYSFMADTATNEPGLSSGLAVLDHLVSHVRGHGVRLDRVMLLGFSQGACLTAEFAVRHPHRYGGIVIFSGGLIGPPGTTWKETGSFAGTPIFLGCSDIDGHVPKERVAESADVFGRMDAKVTLRLYPGMGHLVSDDEISFCQGMMDEVLAGQP
jgi:predicted esterase